MNVRRLKHSRCAGLRRDRRAVAAIEFAIGAMVLISLMFGIINLGLLSLAKNGLQSGVVAAARNASIAATANAAGQTNGQIVAVCENDTPVQSFFDAGSPPFHAPSPTPVASGSGNNFSVTSDGVTLTMAWFQANTATYPNAITLPSDCNAQATTQPQSYVTVTATYRWLPVALPYLFRSGINLEASDTEPIMSPTANQGAS